MCGCPYLKYDWEQNCQACSITKEPKEGSMLCDFDYDIECRLYKDKQSEEQTGAAAKC